ncbi:MAG TPA: hypothetical protein VMM56_05540 [Planctomycetaceae bacterium]|nr:hypothetical protein [Planctomycetaceae bacterium]
MCHRLSHLATGVIMLLAHLFGSTQNLCADEIRNLAVENYLSRLVPIEREIFEFLEREWQNSRHLDELNRAERFRSAMLGFLDRGHQAGQVAPLIPRNLKSIFESRKNIATRELQAVYAGLIREAREAGDEENAHQLGEESAALTASTPPLGLSDGAPLHYCVRPIGALNRGTWSLLAKNTQKMNYSRSLSRISLGEGLSADPESAQRAGQIFLASGEPRRGYLAVEFPADDDPGKYFFGCFENDRQVATISLLLEAGTLYRWRFDLERQERTALFELYDEQSRCQRLLIPWKSSYEMGFGVSLATPQSPARLMLLLLPSTPH